MEKEEVCMTINIKIIFFIILFLLIKTEIYAAVQEDEQLRIISYESSCDNWSLSKADIISFFKNSYEEPSMVLFYSSYVYYNEDLPCEVSGKLKLKDNLYSFKIKQTGNGYISDAINPPNEFDTQDRFFSCISIDSVITNPSCSIIL